MLFICFSSVSLYVLNIHFIIHKISIFFILKNSRVYCKHKYYVFSINIHNKIIIKSLDIQKKKSWKMYLHIKNLKNCVFTSFSMCSLLERILRGLLKSFNNTNFLYYRVKGVWGENSNIFKFFGCVLFLLKIY